MSEYSHLLSLKKGTALFKTLSLLTVLLLASCGQSTYDHKKVAKDIRTIQLAGSSYLRELKGLPASLKKLEDAGYIKAKDLQQSWGSYRLVRDERQVYIIFQAPSAEAVSKIKEIIPRFSYDPEQKQARVPLLFQSYDHTIGKSPVKGINSAQKSVETSELQIDAESNNENDIGLKHVNLKLL